MTVQGSDETCEEILENAGQTGGQPVGDGPAAPHEEVFIEDRRSHQGDPGVLPQPGAEQGLEEVSPCTSRLVI